jgi:hypothetical protein
MFFTEMEECLGAGGGGQMTGKQNVTLYSLVRRTISGNWRRRQGDGKAPCNIVFTGIQEISGSWRRKRRPGDG